VRHIPFVLPVRKGRESGTGNIFYRGADGPFRELNDPASDTCILLEVDAVSFQNKTDSKALLYSSISCQEPPFRGLIPGESADTMLNSARSVRFVFA
jgi:hypothetical protein